MNFSNLIYTGHEYNLNHKFWHHCWKEEGFGKNNNNNNKQILMYILSSQDKGVGKNMNLSLDLEGAVQNYKPPPKIIQIVNSS